MQEGGITRTLSGSYPQYHRSAATQNPSAQRTHTTLSLVSHKQQYTIDRAHGMHTCCTKGTALAMCRGALTLPALANVSTGRQEREAGDVQVQWL